MARALSDASGTERAWGWVAHLRDGGSTPWSLWAGSAEPSLRVLPGAQQLELLRRLNAASPALVDGLADRVLTAAAPGRGKPDLALVDAGASAYGPKPVDPAGLPADELIRVATSVLADDVVALGAPEPRPVRRSLRRSFRVVGDPLYAAHASGHLASAGRVARGPGAHVVVVGGRLDQMLVDTWTRRCFERGSGGWREWLRFWQQREDLPPRVDLPSVVARQRDRAKDVQVVLDPRQLPKVLGVRALSSPVRPGADSTELARRIATVLGLLVPPEQRFELMTRTVWPRIPLTDVPPVALPADHREWVDAAARRMAQQLSRADYPVVGDPDSVRLSESTETAAPAAPVAPIGDLVLDLAVRMLVDPSWKEEPR